MWDGVARQAVGDYSVPMTFIQHLHPDNPLALADEARVDYFDQMHPYWREAVDPDRFVREDQMVLPNGADLTVWAVSDADFDAMCEALWQDPAERPY